MDLHDNDEKKETMSLKAGLFIFILGYSIFSIIFFTLSQLTFPTFYVNSFDVSIYNISIANPFNASSLSSTITATWNIGFIVKNSNKFTKLSYESLAVSVYHGGEKLSSTTIAPFDQVSNTQQHIVAMVHASNITIFNGEVAYAFARDWTRGIVGFDVTVDTRVKLHPKFYFKQRSEMKNICENVKVGVSSNRINGMLLGGSVRC